MKEEMKEKLAFEFIEESIIESRKPPLRAIPLIEIMAKKLREKPFGRARQIFYSLPDHLQIGITVYLEKNIGMISLEEFYCNPN